MQHIISHFVQRIIEDLEYFLHFVLVTVQLFHQTFLLLRVLHFQIDKLLL